ncbi:MAG: hypothetical protein ACI80F_002577 [Natronomonas sp.]|jgi:hypothetical protein|uniref:rod-determining factor RdfA n=1 Tax=Natronomonas sp. TaxID=2184060 RepID=UPI0039892A87
MGDTTETTDCSCKVGRGIERYELENLNSELLHRRQDDGMSLRDLADYVNQRILAAALTAAGVDVTTTLYGAVSSDDALTALYETLANDDTPAEREARVRTRLTQRGIDVEAVEADWVTHTTVRTHLRKCLGTTTRRATTITPDDARDTIEWSRTRCANVAGQTFERLRNADIVSTGSLDITVTIQITCTSCGETYRPNQLLTSRECACTRADDTDDVA